MTDMTINQTYSEIDRFFADKKLPMRMLKVRLKCRGAAQPSGFAILERVKGVEPSSPAWKAGVISRYTTAALLMFDILYFMKKNVNRKMMNL